jgi:hypothetical protein
MRLAITPRDTVWCHRGEGSGSSHLHYHSGRSTLHVVVRGLCSIWCLCFVDRSVRCRTPAAGSQYTRNVAMNPAPLPLCEIEVTHQSCTHGPTFRHLKHKAMGCGPCHGRCCAARPCRRRHAVSLCRCCSAEPCQSRCGARGSARDTDSCSRVAEGSLAPLSRRRATVLAARVLRCGGGR